MNSLNLFEMIPGYLFRDPRLALVHSYLVRYAKPNDEVCATESMQPVRLRPYEVAQDWTELAKAISTEVDAVKKAILQIEEFDLIESRSVENLCIVRFKKIYLPQGGSLQSGVLDKDNRPSITLKALASKYLDYAERNSAPKTVENAQRVLDRFIQIKGDVLIDTLSLRDIEDYKEERRNKVSVATVNLDTRTLKAILERAVDWGYLAENPFRRARQIRQEKRLPLSMEKEEFKQLLSVIEEDYLKRVYIFAALTGMRRGEILNLQWKDVDELNRRITVQSSEFYKVKHGKARNLPYGDHVERILKAIEERFDPFVFTNAKGERLNGDFVTKKFKVAVGNAVLNRDLHFHSLRSTCATWLVEAGAEAFTIKQILGHAYLKTTESYTNAPQKSVVDAMEAISFSPSIGNHLDNRRTFPYISPADETPNSSPNAFEVDSEVVAVKCGESDVDLKGS